MWGNGMPTGFTCYESGCLRRLSVHANDQRGGAEGTLQTRDVAPRQGRPGRAAAHLEK